MRGVRDLERAGHCVAVVVCLLFAMSTATAASAAGITFDDMPGRSEGVQFTSPVFITADAANPTSPVLSGTPKFTGDIEARFTTPVNGFSLDVGEINRRDSVAVDYLDAGGALIGSRSAQSLGINRVTITYRGVAGFRVHTVADEPAGFAIDNLEIERGVKGIAPARMASLGDSYTSGEGLLPEPGLRYECGTDMHEFAYWRNTTMRLGDFWNAATCDTRTRSTEPPGDLLLRGTAIYENLCHRHARAYANQIRQKLGLKAADARFVACSGATTADVLRRSQYPSSPEGVFGGAPQIEYVRAFATGGGPDLITIGIGGNDAHFGEIATECFASDCAGDTEFATGAINTINGTTFDNLRTTFTILRDEFPAATIVAFGYPGVIGDPAEGCDGVSFPFGIGIQEDERRWIKDRVLPAINSSIEDAAAEAGITYVDITRVTSGHELCTPAPWINGLLAGDDQFGVIGSESFHPNQHAHDAIARFFIDHHTDGLGTLLAQDPAPSPPLRPASGQEIVIGTLTAVALTTCRQACTVHLSGTGYAPGSELSVTLHSDPISLGAVRAGPDGRVEADIALPAGVDPGIHTISLEGVTPSGERQYGTAFVRVEPPRAAPAALRARVRVLGWRGRTLYARVRCPKAAPSACRVTLGVAAAGRTLARRTLTAPAGARRIARIRVARRLPRRLTLRIATRTTAGTLRSTRRLSRHRCRTNHSPAAASAAACASR